jgi:hypothetical protein
MTSPSRFTALTLLVASIACHPTPEPVRVDIAAVDYAYQAPQSIRPGLTSFGLSNHGTVPHEIQLFQLRPEIPRDSALRWLARSPNTDSLALDGAGSVLWAPAGVTAHERLLVDAVAGATYAILCQFQDNDSLPQHTRLGMLALIAVE